LSRDGTNDEAPVDADDDEEAEHSLVECDGDDDEDDDNIHLDVVVNSDSNHSSKEEEELVPILPQEFQFLFNIECEIFLLEFNSDDEPLADITCHHVFHLDSLIRWVRECPISSINF
ncbi:unnamed protein product, partial [Arabidopsis halleri]